MVSAYVHINVNRGKGNIIELNKSLIEEPTEEEFYDSIAQLVHEYKSRFGEDIITHKITALSIEKIERVVEEDNDVDVDVDPEPVYVYEEPEPEPIKSTDLSADDAIVFISNNSVGEDFIDDENRVTVKRAFNNKK